MCDMRLEFDWKHFCTFAEQKQMMSFREHLWLSADATFPGIYFIIFTASTYHPGYKRHINPLKVSKNPPPRSLPLRPWSQDELRWHLTTPMTSLMRRCFAQKRVWWKKLQLPAGISQMHESWYQREAGVVLKEVTACSHSTADCSDTSKRARTKSRQLVFHVFFSLRIHISRCHFHAVIWLFKEHFL